MSGERWALVMDQRGGHGLSLVTVNGRLLVATNEQEREVLAFGELVLLPAAAFSGELTVTQWLAEQGYRPVDDTAKADVRAVKPNPKNMPLAEAKPAESSEDR